jgi:hypothetical protein
MGLLLTAYLHDAVSAREVALSQLPQPTRFSFTASCIIGAADEVGVECKHTHTYI